MAFKILCAGCSKDEKEHAEAQVRQALTRLGQGSPSWTVSLVKMGGRWSVRMDDRTGGGRGLTLVAPEGRLAETIVEALEPGAAPASTPAAAAAPQVPPTSAVQRVECQRCRRPFAVLYEGRAGDAEEDVPAACPHCWHINRARIPAEAALASDYRTEKLEA